MEGNYISVQILVDAGADVNAKHNDGETALDFARKSKKNHTMVVPILDDKYFPIWRPLKIKFLNLQKSEMSRILEIFKKLEI